MTLPIFYGNELSSLRRCPKCDSQYDVDLKDSKDVRHCHCHFISYPRDVASKDVSKDVCSCMNKKCNYMFCVIYDARAPINTAPVPSIK